MENIMLFFKDSVYAKLIQDRIIKYIPSEKLSWVFYAESSTALREITEKSTNSWGLLISDIDTIRNNIKPIEVFIKENPRIIVGIQYDTKLPVKVQLKDAILFRRPSDINSWQLVIHQLLNMALIN